MSASSNTNVPPERKKNLSFSDSLNFVQFKKIFFYLILQQFSKFSIFTNTASNIIYFLHNVWMYKTHTKK